MNTFLAKTGSNSRVDACFLAVGQSLPSGCVQFRGSMCRLRPNTPPPPLHPPLLVSACRPHHGIKRDIIDVT